LPDIAGAALRYVGAGYVFGGVPSHGIGQWDCSSFVNWVVGHDSGMAIPGYGAGAYNGSSHGPVVVDWATWSGASNIKGPPNRGDLCVWPGIGVSGHIGIAIDASNMVSALNHIRGTVQTPIAGFGPAGVATVFRSLSGNSGAGVSIPGCLIIPGLAAIHALYHRREWRRYGES
jgi:cell wall-associated NlpC family hydrolase